MPSYRGGEAGSGESLVARVSLSIRLNDGHAAHLIKDGRRSHSRRITIPTGTDVRQTSHYATSHCPPWHSQNGCHRNVPSL